MAEDATTLGVAGLAVAYAAGRLDPVVAIEAHLERIAAEDGRLRSFITVDPVGALAAAAASAGRWRDGRPLGPLDGVPVALKDNIDAAGLPTTAGTAAFRDRVAQADAVVTARLRRAGAAILGKLNMAEAAVGGTTDNAVYGRCMNPLRDGHTPGGSSGGSAAAVAAHLCAASLGTDTLGSVRLPAAYCGLWGFKPSNGAISAEGVVPLSFTLDAVGPLARSAEDLAIVADALLEGSPRSARLPANDSGPASLARLRIGVPLQLAETELSPPVARAFAIGLEALGAAGAEIARIDLGAWSPDKARRAGLLVGEAEGAAYYTRLLGPSLSGLTPALAAMLCYPEKAGLPRVVGAYEAIEKMRLACLRAFGDIDMLALPTAPQTSFPHDVPAPVNQADLTALANFARAPALTAPIRDGDELPAGLQLVAAPGQDRWLLALAAAIERAIAR